MSFSLLTRRGFLRLAGTFVAGAAASGVYGTFIEPFYGLRVTRYKLALPRWTPDLRLRVAVIADLHACDPWMNAERIASIVAMTNDLQPDVVLLLGDYIATHKFQMAMKPELWARELAKLKAPLGVHAVLGNHDWWNDVAAMKRGDGLPLAGHVLQDAGIRVSQNDVLHLEKDGKGFWLAGLGDQIAFVPVRGWRAARYGIDDLAGTLAKVTNDDPVVLMAHEPDVFPTVPNRVSLTISGHTHGGQLNLFGWTPIVPSRYRSRYVYGHKVEENRHLLVSGGLGCSGVPMRIGSPPEIVLIDL